MSSVSFPVLEKKTVFFGVDGKHYEKVKPKQGKESETAIQAMVSGVLGWYDLPGANGTPVAEQAGSGGAL